MKLDTGAIRPLSYLRLLVILVVWLCASCSFQKQYPRFSASGYIVESGAVRLWRKDDENHHPEAMLSVYNAFDNKTIITTRYEYLNGSLWKMTQWQNMPTVNTVQIHFSHEGLISFQQREYASYKESLSHDEMVRYQYQAEKTLAMSNALRAGNVRLIQGSLQNGSVYTCSGKYVVIFPSFEKDSGLDALFST